MISQQMINYDELWKTFLVSSRLLVFVRPVNYIHLLLFLWYFLCLATTTTTTTTTTTHTPGPGQYTSALSQHVAPPQMNSSSSLSSSREKFVRRHWPCPQSSQLMLVVINGPRLLVSVSLSSHDKTRDKKEEFFVLNSFLLPSCEIVGVGSGWFFLCHNPIFSSAQRLLASRYTALGPNKKRLIANAGMEYNIQFWQWRILADQ